MSPENPAEVQHLLTLSQAAARLTICRRTLERLIADGRFPHPVKIGRSSRVLLSDLNAFIAKLTDSRRTA
jgi:excisionase family DNA binding protein